MRRLSSLGSKQLAHRKGRSALTAIGIVLGVAILFGVLVTNATTQTGVDALVADFAGNADVLVSPTGAFDATIPASGLDRIARLDDVDVVAGSLGFRSSIRPLIGEDREPIELSARGVDLASAQRIQPYTLESGSLFADGATEMVAPARLVTKLGVKLGDAVKVQTPFGLRELRLVGVLTDTGAGRTNQGDVLFTSLRQARVLKGVGNVISGARVVLADGTDIEAWIKDHRADLAGLDVENADSLAQGFKQFLSLIGVMFTFFAAITLFVGAFLIYLTLSMAVIERTRIYGTMRALGATRRQVRRVVVTEALVLGSASTVVGLGVGLLIAKGLLALVSQLFELDLPGLTIEPTAIVSGVVVGVLVTLLSSLVPARRAAKLSPVVAMKGDYRTETRLSRGWIAGVVAAVLGIAIGLSGGGAGAPLILLGAVLLTPLLLRPLARLLGRVTNRIARGVGDIAVLHLVKERSRSAYTLALVMVVMAMIFSIGGLYASLADALDESLDRQFGADIHIDASGQLDPSFERDLRATEGVGPVSGLRIGSVQFIKTDGDQEQFFARIVDPSTYFEVSSFLFASGTENDAKRGLVGGSVLMPEGAALRYDLAPGALVKLATTSGPRTFRLAATYRSFGGPPEFVIGLPDARRYFNAAAPSSFQLNVSPGASVSAVRARIESQLGARNNLHISTVASIKAEARTQFGQFFNVFYAIILVAAIVGLLGLANTLAMGVLQRYREIGILRAIGVTRPQVRRMVFVESATLAVVAFVLSLPLGWVLSVVTLAGVGSAFGFDVGYVYPAAWVPIVAAFGVIVAVLAALAPGRRAARLEVVSALQYE